MNICLKQVLDIQKAHSRWVNNETVAAIESYRKLLLTDNRNILTLSDSPGKFDDQLISKAVKGSKGKDHCLRLCNLAAEINIKSHFDKFIVIELGTNLGISSAYLSLGASQGARDAIIFTAECSSALLKIAQDLHKDCGLNNIQYISGYFEVTLKQILESVTHVDLCFIDGDHQYTPTWNYFNDVKNMISTGGVIVFDDIYWSEGMRAAWNEISSSQSFRDILEVDGVGFIAI